MKLSEKICVGLFILLPILPITSSLVIAAPKYTPPPTGRQPQRTESSGSRGCNRSLASTPFYLLVPNDHVGTTVSSHPTFFWYLSNRTRVPMRFTLVEPEVSPPIFETRLHQLQPGIVQLQLPSNVPALKYGKQYTWTVSLICNERRPSQNAYASAWIKREPLDSINNKQVQQNLATNNHSTRASVYAQLGIWYDAISESYRSTPGNTQNQLPYNFISLLEQVGLGKIVALEHQRLVNKQRVIKRESSTQETEARKL